MSETSLAEKIADLEHSMKIGQPWINKKTGKSYRLCAIGTDCTNSRAGTKIIAYVSLGKIGGKLYVREVEEFYDKFEYAILGG